MEALPEDSWLASMPATHGWQPSPPGRLRLRRHVVVAWALRYALLCAALRAERAAIKDALKRMGRR